MRCSSRPVSATSGCRPPTGLVVVGAYPAGTPAYDLLREGAEDSAGIRARIAAVALPATDPVDGKIGAVQKDWD